MHDTISAITLSHRKRQQWVRAATRLTNQIKAIDRIMKDEPEAVRQIIQAPLHDAIKPLHEARKFEEKVLASLVKDVPALAWWCEIRGLNVLGFAQVIGEAGDIGAYRNPSCLWKRFGLHVTDGKAPRPTSGEKLDYSPARRATMHVIGSCLVMTSPNPYRDLYLARKEYEIEKVPDLKPWQHNARAMRYMEKRLLKHLWQQWRGQQIEPVITEKAA